MKTRLLRKLRREANEHFRFTIIKDQEYGAWSEVYSFGEPVYFTCDGIKGANARIAKRNTRKEYVLENI